MSKDQPGRRPIEIVEIAQPSCELRFSMGACGASNSLSQCYNTRSTCKSESDFSLSERSVFFSRPGDPRPKDALHLIPLLSSVSISPVRINLTGADRNSNPLGISASATIVFSDAPHSDRVVDPYVDERPGPDPLQQSTFWRKWFARNKYGRTGTPIRIYRGYAGQSLSEMVLREYSLEAIDFSSSNRVTARCRDLMGRTSEETAQVPAPSPGFLISDLTTTTTHIQLGGALIGDYPATGFVRVNREIIGYSEITERGDKTLLMRISSRANFNTELAAHAVDDQVQICLFWRSAIVSDALRVLFDEYTGIPPENLDLEGWASEVDEFLPDYRLGAVLSTPTAVRDILAEICEQTLSFIYWDEVSRLVRFRAIRPMGTPPRGIDDNRHIIAGSVSVSEKPKSRASQVWIYYLPKDPTENRDKVENYRALEIIASPELERAEFYGEPAIRKIYARFLTTRAQALQTAARIFHRYQDTPRDLSFSLDAKDGDISIGDYLTISTDLIIDETGSRSVIPWMVKSVHPSIPGERLDLVAEDATLAGTLASVVDDDTPPYRGDGTDPQYGFVISDEDGFLPNGDNGSRIW